MQQRTANLPVSWLGVVPAQEFYKKIDVLIVPALWADPGPLVVHEAFANSVPVVGSRMGGISDFIQQDVTGWLFTPGDIAQLTDDLAKRIAAGGPSCRPKRHSLISGLKPPQNESPNATNMYRRPETLMIAQRESKAGTPIFAGFVKIPVLAAVLPLRAGGGVQDV